MPGPVYAADPESCVRLVPLDGLTLLFHAPSGTTHFLAPPAPEILSALRDAPADAARLLARLAQAFDLDQDEAAATALSARLAELEEAGLVFRQ